MQKTNRITIVLPQNPMLNFIGDRIGDWNPQLLRELKGQLKPLKIGLAIALAIIGQIIFLLVMWGQLPGELSPADLAITTYPEINLQYNDSRADLFTVDYLYYKTPLEHIPGQDFQVTPNVLRRGDRIVAVDGVPLYSGAENLDGAGLSGGDKNQILRRAITRPFADDWETVENSPPQVTTGPIWVKANRLRQQVPGTSVTLTIQRGDSNPDEVTLPRILYANVGNSYCLQPDGWDELTQPHLRSAAYTTPEADNVSYQARCRVTPGGQSFQIDWADWHRHAFWFLSIATLFPVLILGTFSIVSNLLKEEREGTFNFIRLSPQSAWDILFGKLLGIPILFYLAVLLILPLNLIHGLGGGLTPGVLLSFYGATIALTFLTFSFALLLGLVNLGLGMVQAWLGAGTVFSIQMLCLQISYYGSASDANFVAWPLLFTPFSTLRSLNQKPFVDHYRTIETLFHWFDIPLIPLVGFGLLLVNVVVLSRWVWGALTRRFFMPTGTVISKAQSYGLTLFVNVSLLGFSWRSPEYMEPKRYSPWMNDHLLTFAIVHLMLWVVLIVLLSPQQQNLQDWARYRHRMPGSLSRFKPQSLWSDWSWGEKSPIIGAIAVNLLIELSLTLVWVLHHALLQPKASTAGWLLHTLIAFIACINVMLIGTTLAQFVFLYRNKYAVPIVLGLLFVFLVSPPIILGLTTLFPSDYPQLLGLTIFPWAIFDNLGPYFFKAPGWLLPLGLQWGSLGVLNWFLARQFKKIGESDVKALLREA